MQRVIAHIDMNSYFASCEQQDNKSWRGKPLGVCEHLGGIIIAASVEAKKWGVKTGTPVWEAKVLCPQIVLTKTSPDRYRFYTAKFYRLLEEYSGIVERYSIDEAFLDLTKVCNATPANMGADFFLDPFVEAKNIALEIKSRLKKEVGDWLSCSVGIAWNKLVAKIASDLQKPDGLVVVRPEEKAILYSKIKITDVPGIANRQARRLMMYGIRTLKDLRDCPESHLVAWFGIPGKHLSALGRLEGFFGESFEYKTFKSLGHMYTIEKGLRNVQGIGESVMARLAEFLGRRLRALRLMAKNLVVWVDGDGEQAVFGRSCLGDGENTGKGIYVAGVRTIEQNGGWPTQVTRVGLTVYGLSWNQSQLSLFKSTDKAYKLALAMDKVNGKYTGSEGWDLAKTTAGLGNVPSFRGMDVLLPANAFFARHVIRDSIGFGRLKELGSLSG